MESEKSKKAMKYIDARNLHKTNAVCDLCHGVGEAIEFKYPITKFYCGGTNLSSRCHSILACEDCSKRLVEVIKVAWKENVKND